MKRAAMLFAEAKENKMEIYNDILSAIFNLELINGEAKPTRVQTLSNLAYDKLVRYLNEFEGKKMITQERRTLIFRPYHHISSISMIIGAIWYVRNVKAKLIFVLDDYKSGENNQVSRKLLPSLILPSSKYIPYDTNNIRKRKDARC